MNYKPGINIYELDSSSELISTKGDITASPPVTPHATMVASSSSPTMPKPPEQQTWTVPGAISIDYTNAQHSPIHSPSSSSQSPSSPVRPIQVMGSYVSPPSNVNGYDNSSIDEQVVEQVSSPSDASSNANTPSNDADNIGNDSNDRNSSATSSPENFEDGSKNRTEPADISSRRKKRGSTIILGRDQVRHYQERAARIEQEDLERRNRELSRIREQAAEVEKKKISSVKIQKLWKKKSGLFLSHRKAKNEAGGLICHIVSSYLRKKKMLLFQNAAVIIQRHIRRVLASKIVARIRKFTMDGKWSESQSHKMFALILAWRVRKIMKSNAIKFSKNSISDVYVMLQDIVDDALAKDTSLHLSNMSHLVSVENLLLYSRTTGGGNDKASIPSLISSTRSEHLKLVGKCLNRPALAFNWAIIRGLVKQIVVTKASIHATFFGLLNPSSTVSSSSSCKWYSFPPPGYWDLGPSVRNVIKLEKPIKLMPNNESHSSITGNSLRKSPKLSPSNDKSLLRIIKKKGARKSVSSASSSPIIADDDIISQRVVDEPDCDSISDERRKSVVSPSDVISKLKIKFPAKKAQSDSPEEQLQPSPSNLEGNSSASACKHPLESTPSAPIRQSSKAHLQLSVLGAENLMAANKSKATRDNSNPDRRPSLRATLYLPKAPSSSPSYSSNVNDEQRKYHQCTLDAPLMPTYNPVWNEPMYIPLPTPKALLPGMASPPSTDPLSNYKDLLAYWGQGEVKIEILDTERFNGDIHLGEVTLLLSSLCNTTFQKSTLSSSPDPHVLKVSGSYELRKGEGSRRVSGRLSLCAYLHLPIKLSSARSSSYDSNCESTDRNLRDLPSPPIGDIRSMLDAEGNVYKHHSVSVPHQLPISQQNHIDVVKPSTTPVKLKPRSSSPGRSNENSRSSIIAGLSQQLNSISQSIESMPLPPTPPRGLSVENTSLKQCQSPELNMKMTARRTSVVQSVPEEDIVKITPSEVQKHEDASFSNQSFSAVPEGAASNGHSVSGNRKGRAERLSMISMALDNIMDMQQSLDTGATLEAKLNSKLAMIKSGAKNSEGYDRSS